MSNQEVRGLYQGSILAIHHGTENEKGSGIGLSLVKEFLAHHNGSLEIASELRKGSTFTIILPCSEKLQQKIF